MGNELTGQEIHNLFRNILLAHITGIFTIKPTYGRLTWSVLTDIVLEDQKETMARSEMSKEWIDAANDIIRQCHNYSYFIRDKVRKSKRKLRRKR